MNNLLPSLAPRRALLGGLVGVTVVVAGCSLFQRDELAGLAAEVLDAPATTLALATVDAAPEIPPLRPGELQPLAGSPEQGLRILGVAPQAEELDPSQVAVVFDRPMVALDAIDATSAAVPVRCEPGVAGRMRWAGTSTAVIVPEGYRFPSATEFRCEIPAGTAALDGTTLERTVSWTFATRRPALERSRPSDGESQWDPKDPIVLRFNQPVSPEGLRGAVSLRTEDGLDVALEFARGEGKQERPDVVLARGALAPDTAYTLMLAEGLKGAEGSLGLAAEQQVAFRTYPPLGVASFGPTEGAVSPLDPIQLEFTTRVDAALVNQKIRITPPPPDGFKPADAYESERWSYWTRLAPRTTYTVSLEPGLTDVHGQQLAAGRTWSFTTGDLPAMVDAPEGFNVYPANNPLSLPIRHRNVSALDVSLTPVDVNALVFGGDRFDWRDLPAAPSVRVEPSEAPNRVQIAKVDLTPGLGPTGHGLVRVEVTAREVREWNGELAPSLALLQVTDLGATLKLGPGDATVWVTRLSDGAPVAGAEVQIVRSGKSVWVGNTDTEGLAVAAGDLVPDDWSSWRDPLWLVVRAGEDVAVTSHRWDDGLEGWSHGVYASFDPVETDLQIASFTDRGVYRPGDRARVQVTLREASLTGLAVPTVRKLKWKLNDPNGQELGAGEAEADAFGTWTTELALPADGALGEYGLEIDAGSERTWVWVPVRAYRAPAFRVDVGAPDTAVAGGAINAHVEGRYLFGASMRGARATWTVAREPLALAPSGWEGFSFDVLPSFDMWETRPGYENVSSGEGALDEAGRLAVTQGLPAGAVRRPWTYTIEGTVTDTDRQQLSARRAVDVHVAEAYVGVRAAGGLPKAGDAVTARIAAVRPDGEAKAGVPVEVEVLRRTWDVVREKGMDGTWRWVNTTDDERIASATVTSGAEARSWTFTPKEGGYYVVRVRGPGLGGAETVAEDGVYVLGGNVSWARSDTRTLELVPDAQTYAPGSTAKVLVKAPKAGMRALVTVEREGVWTRRIMTLTSTAQAVEVPITAEMMPNAFVTVLAVEGARPADSPDAGKPGIWYGVTELAVESAQQRVAVTLTTDREAYQPGETVKVRLEANRDGRALGDAAVTLWAVDHGVLSLTAYETPDLHAAFYRARPLGVLTADNRISVYDRAHYLAKGAEPGGGGGEASSGDTRRRFETTPLWTRLRTDAGGILEHSFTLPDNLTTFRIMAAVQDRGAAFGSAEHEVRVNRPLIARPALPRFFREGDRALAGVVLHNNTSSASQVSVAATATGATLKGAPRTVEVPADGAVEVPFALTEFQGPNVRLRFEANGGGNRDAVEVEVPVSSPLPQEVVATAGSTMAEARERIAVPDAASRKVGGLTVDLSASALVGIGSSVDYLLAYPHGCLEQIGSRTRVALLARALGDRAGVATSPETLTSYVRTGLSKLDGFRTAQGGYGYWPGGEASGPASAYALEILAEARAAGENVDDRELERLAAFVRAFLAGRHVPRWWSPELTRAAQARAALALARAERGDAAFNARIWDLRKDLPLYGKAQLLETLARTTGPDARTRALTAELAGALHVEATSAALVERDARAWQALWFGDDLATSALVRAWMQAAPDHPMLERLARHLVGARRHGRWANTYTTAEALLALRDYAGRYEGGAVTAAASLAGDPLLQRDLGVGGQATASVPMNALKPGELLLSASGGRLYYETRLAYAVPSLPPRDEGFTLSRTYEVLEGTGTGRQVSPGAIVRVTLRAVTPIDRFNVAMSDPLPAGLEPVDTAFATTARAGGGRDTGVWQPRDTGIFAEAGPQEWSSSWIFNRRELRDDRVVLYADHMPAGVHVQTYLARATTPGDYAHPAATIEEMYAQEVFGRTEAGRFVVGASLASR